MPCRGEPYGVALMEWVAVHRAILRQDRAAQMPVLVKFDSRLEQLGLAKDPVDAIGLAHEELLQGSARIERRLHALRSAHAAATEVPLDLDVAREGADGDHPIRILEDPRSCGNRETAQREILRRSKAGGNAVRMQVQPTLGAGPPGNGRVLGDAADDETVFVDLGLLEGDAVEHDVVLPTEAARKAGHEQENDCKVAFQIDADCTTFRPLSAIKYFDWQYRLRR